ncbi:MAG: hypothetical protein IMF26_03815 [Candidatus Fermentithermobacillus carboniphilus]|uniref:Uncharacterized protein n=1 Tax=Candidatus Fermentithermobacillus carboniphilus TaxID=3085328 RepID=A0AAT9LDV0_9FIRM|nr:MAG: hypothetical protein IMF26_03815 [Candidatus Fermentithermobacillus carboniphilus]
MEFFKRLGEIDNRVIYILLILSLLIPLMKPLGLPISVGAHTRRSFSVIDKLQAGDRVIVDISYSVSGAADVQPQAVAILKHLFDKGAKAIFVTTVTEGPMIIESLVKPWEQAGKRYGVDFCNLGFLAGGENAIAMYCRDIKKAYPTDYRGNATSELPVLEGIHSAGDVKMYIFFSTQNSDMYVRQVTQYKIPIIGGLINTIAPQAEPYVNAGQLAGILVGLRGGAEYEILMKSPGMGVASMDAQSMGHLLIIMSVVLGNLSYFLTRSAKPVKKGAVK